MGMQHVWIAKRPACEVLTVCVWLLRVPQVRFADVDAVLDLLARTQRDPDPAALSDQLCAGLVAGLSDGGSRLRVLPNAAWAAARAAEAAAAAARREREREEALRSRLASSLAGHRRRADALARMAATLSQPGSGGGGGALAVSSQRGGAAGAPHAGLWAAPPPPGKAEAEVTAAGRIHVRGLAPHLGSLDLDADDAGGQPQMQVGRGLPGTRPTRCCVPSRKRAGPLREGGERGQQGGSVSAEPCGAVASLLPFAQVLDLDLGNVSVEIQLHMAVRSRGARGPGDVAGAGGEAARLPRVRVVPRREAALVEGGARALEWAGVGASGEGLAGGPPLSLSPSGLPVEPAVVVEAQAVPLQEPHGLGPSRAPLLSADGNPLVAAGGEKDRHAAQAVAGAQEAGSGHPAAAAAAAADAEAHADADGEGEGAAHPSAADAVEEAVRGATAGKEGARGRRAGSKGRGVWGQLWPFGGNGDSA
jgi:hypothetical protein